LQANRSELTLDELGVPIDATAFLFETLQRYEIEVPAEAGPLFKRYLQRAVRGHAGALPAICQGENCPFLQHCWIRQINEEAGTQLPYPVGKACPQEVAVLEATIVKLAQLLGLDPGDPSSAEQMELIYELAAHELLRTRVAYYLAENPQLFSREVVGYSQQGVPIFDVKINPALLATERLSKLVAKLREQLLATPKAQAQAGKALADPSTKAAELRKRLADLAKRRRITDAEFDVS